MTVHDLIEELQALEQDGYGNCDVKLDDWDTVDWHEINISGTIVRNNTGINYSNDPLKARIIIKAE